MSPFIPIFCRIQRHILDNFLKVGKPLSHGRFLRSFALHGFGGVLRKGGIERVGIPGLEKDEVSAVGAVLFQRKVPAVFLRNVFKGLRAYPQISRYGKMATKGGGKNGEEELQVMDNIRCVLGGGKG